jgi:Flp pilus assembly protein TadD
VSYSSPSPGLQSQEYRSSVSAYTLAIRLMPTAAAAYSNRAAAYLKLKQYKEAEADCTKALEIDPLYKKVRSNGLLMARKLL